jgi:peptide/nickel transport system substrate-binding protein
MNRRTWTRTSSVTSVAFTVATAWIAAMAMIAPLPAQAQPRKDTLVLAMTLEPPGLDPTAGAASAIAEITQYNLCETLTKVGANSWQ